MNIYKHAATVLLSGCAISAAAQDKTKDTAGNNVSLSEVIISVNKSVESKRAVAQQVIVLDQKQITNANAQTTAGLLANTAGIFVQQSQMGGGSPVLRGFEANKILLVVDGVRMNNLIYRGGHLQNVITIDNAMLERTEILFGPSSTVYGSDALGGVIHFYTRQPVFAAPGEHRNTNANAYIRYGSVNNEMTGHADFGIGGKKLASLTSVTYSSFGDLRMGQSQNFFYDKHYWERGAYATRVNGRDTMLTNADKYKQLYSGYTQYDIMQKIAFRQNEHTTHQLNLQYSTSSDIPRYDRLTDMSNGVLKSAQWYYGPQKRAMAAYDGNKNNAASFFQKKHVGINFQRIEESRHNRNFGSNNLAHRTEKVKVMGVNIDYERQTGDHTIRWGAEQQTNMLVSAAERENIVTGARQALDTRYPDGNNSMLSSAAFGSHTWHINDKFTFTDGLRLGYVTLRSAFEDTSFFHLPFKEVAQNNFVYSGSAGLIHTPTAKWKLSALVATGFRAPNVDDLAKVFESVPGSLIVPNSNLKPEKTINTEIGITKVFGSNTIWENVLYYTQYIDAIVTTATTYNGADSVMYDGVMSRVLANQNQGTAYIYGLSSGIRSKLGQYLLLSANVNYTYGRINTDTTAYPLDHISPLTFSTRLSYSRSKAGADFFINYNGAKQLKDYYRNGEDNEQYATATGMPAWMTLNLRISYKVHKHIVLQAGIDNILDTQYRVFASGINAAGRNIFGTVRFSY